MATSQYEEEDIYDVQPTNILSVQRMKEVFVQNEKMNSKQFPIKYPKPVPQKKPQINTTLDTNKSDENVPVLPEKTVDKKNSNDSPPVIPDKSIGKKLIIEKEKVLSNNRLTPKRASQAFINNPFLQNDQNQSKPPVSTKPKPSPGKMSPRFDGGNAKPPELSPKSTNGSTNQVKPAGNPESSVLPSKNNDMKNVVSELKQKNDGNNNEKISSASEDSPVSRPKPAVASKGPKRVSTIKRKSIKRIVDGRTFLQIPLVKIDFSAPVPAKPEKVDDFDLASVVSEYQKQLSVVGDGQGYEEDEIYDDIALPPSRYRAVSLIKPMSEDEEWPKSDSEDIYDDTANNNVYDDTAVSKTTVNKMRDPPPTPVVENNEEPVHDPSEDYDELTTRESVMAEDDSGPSQMYEAVDDLREELSKTQDEEKNQPEVVEDEKISEKERKKREKDEKDRQKKEQKKKEKGIKDLKKNYKIDLDILKKVHPIGKIKVNDKGGKLDLTVVVGQTVKIVRMLKPNPPGKWLVQLEEDETVGYVRSDNVQVMQANGIDVNPSEGAYEDV